VRTTSDVTSAPQLAASIFLDILNVFNCSYPYSAAAAARKGEKVD
jgi:hypothetical protein